MFFLPSRSRPHNLLRFLDAWDETRATERVLLILYPDDPTLPQYRQILLPPSWLLFLTPPDPAFVGPKLNMAFHTFPTEPFYGALADDIVPRTMNWDKLLAAAANNHNVAWPDDTIQGAGLCTHFVVGGDLVRRYGWFSLPGLKGLYIDNVWMHIGGALNRLCYLPGVILEHRHWSNNKAPLDASYERHSHYVEDREVFERWWATWETAHAKSN